MRAKHSAGLLMFRWRPHGLEVFLVHPGGPFFARKDAGVWTLPKGEPDGDEPPEAAARREFFEETGRRVEECGTGEWLHLGTVRQAGGKDVEAWAFEGDWPEGVPVLSTTFEMEWPPRSGRRQVFPEVDEGRFFAEDEARRRINPAQAAFIHRLIEALGREP